ncbi:MAG: pseudouridine synthase [Butyricimonas paravirosa]
MYPIGRLDRQTTGVLLFTNDGDLAKKLTHPKYNQKKIYHVFLDKVVQTGDLEAIRKGIDLEDGFIQADDVEWRKMIVHRWGLKFIPVEIVSSGGFSSIWGTRFFVWTVSFCWDHEEKSAQGALAFPN